MEDRVSFNLKFEGSYLNIEYSIINIQQSMFKYER